MRAGRNRPGASTDFIDSSSQEILLRVACSAQGEALLAYRLYDATGQLVAQTDSFVPLCGVSVVAPDGDLLLQIPEEPGDQIRYRLYNKDGRLLTCSDGMRTQVYAFLRLEKGKV